MGLKVKITETFTGGGITIDGSPSKTVFFSNRCMQPWAPAGLFSRSGQIHRRSQDFLWGCTFFLIKSWRPF